MKSHTFAEGIEYALHYNNGWFDITITTLVGDNVIKNTIDLPDDPDTLQDILDLCDSDQNTSICTSNLSHIQMNVQGYIVYHYTNDMGTTLTSIQLPKSLLQHIIRCILTEQCNECKRSNSDRD